ncbi:MAG TPA: PTS sugar transporter subunit IIA [Syntrophales bacterium]|nr:PTS sugar transporter subunit IIA [Syntrophobacterales bacterium]HRR41741.1 PTS sugar transporter subunit IIA [Syntrophales bacterium]HRT27196.1 PTS sugar transporter subunit IIA [Syntrophales bacterium]HRT69903.1 PTS sugar transporter subunit IIA [Syntrophales bacterium]
MNISGMIAKKYILEDLKSSRKQDVLSELTAVFGLDNDLEGNNQTVKVLLEREKLGSTGIGEGIAIPHGKVPGIEKIYIGFGRSKTGVDFNSLDGRPVHLFFVLLAPENSSSTHLKALAKLSRMLMDQPFREDLMKAESTDVIYSAIVDMDRRVI